MTFTQHVERPKIKNSCHHHQVNFSYLWVVVVVSSCGSINIKILFVWKKIKDMSLCCKLLAACRI